MYDIVIVGSGFCGSVIAKKSASIGKKVLIIEKRSVVGGNMRDEPDDDGVIVQKYGPHVFHTDNEEVYDFCAHSGEWFDFEVTYSVSINGKEYDAPFGFHTIDLLFDINDAAQIKNALKESYPKEKAVSILRLLDNHDEKVKRFAKFLYNNNYVPYAIKQWGIGPNQLDSSVIGRMPILLESRNHYFDVKHELLPVGGYSVYFENMLMDKNIDISLNSDATERIELDSRLEKIRLDGEILDCPLVYTGRLDLLLVHKEVVPYRSMRFKYKKCGSPFFQNRAIVTYPNDNDYIRITDYNRFMKEPANKTTVSFEFPELYNSADTELDPYYPILTKENIIKNKIIQEEAQKYKDLFVCGRLAEYKYYNMDQAIERALCVFDDINKKYWS